MEMELSELLRRLEYIEARRFVGSQNVWVDWGDYRLKISEGGREYLLELSKYPSETKRLVRNSKNKEIDTIIREKTSLIKLGFIDDLEDTEPQKLMQEAKELLEKESVAPKDNVNNPSHYTQGNIECIDVMESMLTPEEFRGFLRGSIFKYQWRFMQKNGVEDLKKSQWYLNKLIEKLEDMK